MQQIEQEVRQFVIDNFVFDASNGNLSNDDSFFDTGLLDSMGVLTLVEFVCGKYSITIVDNELQPDNWDSVNRIATFVRSRIAPAEISQEASATTA